MFWVRLNDLFQLYCIILIFIAWLIVLCLLYNVYKEEKIENRKYDINHKTIKDIKVRKEEKK